MENKDDFSKYKCFLAPKWNEFKQELAAQKWQCQIVV